ncbi:MAG TPA: DUF3053 family protein [Stellaceae bacterium]|nr:DUF3053 family protein [Stellaceae bacterium]
MRFALRAAIIVMTVLTGCNDEPAQRRAFIDFLQEHIIWRPGVHIVLMNEELRKSFGPYASHYQIILDFNSDFDLKALEAAAKLKSEVHDLAGLVEYRRELEALQQAVPGVIATVDRRLATADAAHAALQQPPDLKTVYDQAFDRLVTRPGTLLARMLPLLDKNLAAMIELADYVAANPNAIRIEGMDGTSNSPEIDRRLHELLDAVHLNDEAGDDLKRQFKALLSGS